MREIGGYIELDTFTGEMLHDDGIKLNCGRNALEYLIFSKGIKKLLFPKFMCDSCDEILKRNNVSVRYYSIGIDFKPLSIDRDEDEFLYIVNYYGQLANDYLLSLGDNVIVDNAQAYFNEPIDGIDTIYTCRKFFGVPDGAILYTDKMLDTPLEQSESFQRMHHLLGRYERTASEYYRDFTDNEQQFFNDKLMTMSKLTNNLLHGIDYEFVSNRRRENFQYLDKQFKSINKLDLIVPNGAFMYPLYINNGAEIRKELQKEKIFIPTLWPSVSEVCDENELEYDMANNILPVPVDQRYAIDSIEKMVISILTLDRRIKNE